MSVPKICGLETEYGLLVGRPEALTQTQAAISLLDRCPVQPRVPWDMGAESPSLDARDDVPPRDRIPWYGQATDQGIDGSHAGFMLGNGARLYVDHGHPEYATPECADVLSLVAHDRAGERLMERCQQYFTQFLPLNQSVELFKNNSDHQGHSYGCHENYLMDAGTYRALFRSDGRALRSHLVPFLVSRIVVCGSGKVGSEYGRPQVDFQISQRADFFETVLGLQTMSQRPIVNTRDEPHADADRFRRLHVISGDANMSQVSTYLKVGTMQALLAMLEDGAWLPDLELADPVAAIVDISHDPSCRREVRLADGRHLTAVELQQAFAEATARYLASSEAATAQYQSIYERWVNVLEQLAEEPQQLAGTLDWVTKWTFLAGWRQRKCLPWSAPELEELDIRYHAVDRQTSVYQMLATADQSEGLIDESSIDLAQSEPPPATRASRRASEISTGDEVKAASWSTVVRLIGGSCQHASLDIL